VRSAVWATAATTIHISEGGGGGTAVAYGQAAESIAGQSTPATAPSVTHPVCGTHKAYAARFRLGYRRGLTVPIVTIPAGGAIQDK